MTIGDILAVIAFIFAVGATWAATILLASLAFPERARWAQERIVASPGASLGRGLGVLLVLGLLALVFGNLPGPARLVSGALWASLGALAAVGSAGIARLLGERIQGVGSHMTPFATLTRGTVLYVAAGFLPIIGWFLVAPLALLLSLGGASWAVTAKPVRVSPPAPNPGGTGDAVVPSVSPELGRGSNSGPPVIGGGGGLSEQGAAS